MFLIGRHIRIVTLCLCYLKNLLQIQQGEVESISQMKPKAANEHEDGLLEYLEDIIGTSKYKEPIEEASVQLEKSNEERMEKVNRLKMVENDMKALESQKKEAEDYLEEENTLVKLKSKLYQYYVHESVSNVATAEAEVVWHVCMRQMVKFDNIASIMYIF